MVKRFEWIISSIATGIVMAIDMGHHTIKHGLLAAAFNIYVCSGEEALRENKNIVHLHFKKVYKLKNRICFPTKPLGI